MVSIKIQDIVSVTNYPPIAQFLQKKFQEQRSFGRYKQRSAVVFFQSFFLQFPSKHKIITSI